MKRATERKRELDQPQSNMIEAQSRKQYNPLNMSETSCDDTSRRIFRVKRIFLGVRSIRKLNVYKVTVL